jgi:hypothetical protein
VTGVASWVELGGQLVSSQNVVDVNTAVRVARVASGVDGLDSDIADQS